MTERLKRCVENRRSVAARRSPRSLAGIFLPARKQMSRSSSVNFARRWSSRPRHPRFSGSSREISIRDNGTGIPPEVKEKMFNPFFTTKPAGEGTGLGLSISHDIVVKQHAGSIEVNTRPGEFTEVRIILPRSARFVAGV